MGFWEILIGAVVFTLLTVLLTGPGLWSSSWGYRNKERPQVDPKHKDPTDPK